MHGIHSKSRKSRRTPVWRHRIIHENILSEEAGPDITASGGNHDSESFRRISSRFRKGREAVEASGILQAQQEDLAASERLKDARRRQIHCYADFANWLN
jgi:hypothetical protein